VTRIRAVLLDFGGTLDSDGKHWSTQFADSFAAAGVPVDRPTLDRAFVAADRAVALDPRAETMAFADYVRDYAERMLTLVGSGGAGQAAAVAGHFVRVAFEHLRSNAALLVREHSRFRFAVVSNFTANLPLILGETGLTHVFDAVVCSAIEQVKKPDPSIFRLALARLGVGAGESAMVGDSLGNDIVPAKELGLTTVWLRGDRNFSGGQASAADHVVSNLDQALSLLRDDSMSLSLEQS
jgi:putative hydrolase of the HAD superfamily